MKISTLLLFSLLSISSIGQDNEIKSKPDYNRWSLDLNLGLNKAVRNYAPGYSSAFMGIGETNFGARFMVNSYFGFDLKFGFDRFQDDKPGTDFSTNMSRFGIQGVFNIGNICNFHEWTDKFTVLMHTGVALGNISDDGFPIYSKKNDKVGVYTFGISPMFKINDRLSVNFDGSIHGISRMHHTWDYTVDYYSNHFKGDDYGLNGHFYTATVGMSYYFGKKETHADWTPTKSVNQKDLDALAAEMDKMRKGMLDDDQDGVPNYLDDELNTPAKTPVDAKGVSDLTKLDTDGDGIADGFDACPEDKGFFSTNGCPDGDLDGVPDNIDKCPNEKGTLADDGCPSKDKSIVSAAISIVYFETSSYDLSRAEKAKLDVLVTEMKANPSKKLMAKGHADARGDNDFNQDLSKNRAIAAKNYLVKKGIDPSRIQTTGFGSSLPAQTNDTDSGRAMNRRVEFVWM